MSCAEEKKQSLQREVSRCIKELYNVECEFSIIRPRQTGNGNLSATAALVLGKILRRPPIEIAREIVCKLSLDDGESAEAASKGYINFFLKPNFMYSELDPNLKLPNIELPPLESDQFSEIYPIARLTAVLKYQGTAPTQGDRLTFTSEGEELLWAIFFGSKAEILRRCQEFYDRVGLKNTDKAIAAGNYVLLSNGIYELMRKD